MRFIFSVNALGRDPIGNINGFPVYSYGGAVEVDNRELTVSQVEQFLNPLLELYSVPVKLRQSVLDSLVVLAAQKSPEPQMAGEFDSLGMWLTVEFYDPEALPISHFEFEMEIKHPSKATPWKVTGSGRISDIEALLLGGLSQYTQLPQLPSWDKHVTDIKKFLDHIPNCDAPDHDFKIKEHDYSVELTVTTISEMSVTISTPISTHLR